MCLCVHAQLANFIMTIAFAIDITAAMVDPPAIVLIIQLTLLAMTVVFGFGLWITCKRKFILLKIYTLVLAAFVVVQIIALAALATGSGNSDECDALAHASALSARAPPLPRADSPAAVRAQCGQRCPRLGLHGHEGHAQNGAGEEPGRRKGSDREGGRGIVVLLLPDELRGVHL